MFVTISNGKPSSSFCRLYQVHTNWFRLQTVTNTYITGRKKVSPWKTCKFYITFSLYHQNSMPLNIIDKINLCVPVTRSEYSKNGGKATSLLFKLDPVSYSTFLESFLMWNVKLALRNLSGKNTLAYFAEVCNDKRFFCIGQRARDQMCWCLSLANISSLVGC